MENNKRTPLYNEHVKLGAKMVPFAGWEMPLQYTGIIEEHLNVRQNVGLFDVSHMGEFFISGEESLQLLQKLVPHDLSKLEVSKAVYTQLINKNAGIVDDLIVYRLNNEGNHLRFLLIVNASRINEDLDWIEFNKKNFDFKVDIDNKSDELSMLAVQGPKAPDLIQDMGIPKQDQPARFTIKETKLNSFDIFISRTGYTGEDGFEIIVKNDNAVALWNEILEKGNKYGIKPIGLGARDTLRLESSMLLYGQDMDEKTTPVEASLGWSVSRDKADDYYGKDVILSQLNGESKPEKILVGFRMLDKAIPRHNYEIYKDGEKVGYVTSGGIGPAIEANIGLGYISSNIPSIIGTKLDIMIRNKFYAAEIVKRPFYVKSKKG